MEWTRSVFARNPTCSHPYINSMLACGNLRFNNDTRSGKL